MFIGRRRYSDAEYYFKQLERIESNSRGVLRLGATLKTKQGRHAEALPFLRRLLALAPKDESAVILLAESLLNCGQHKAAVAELDRFSKEVLATRKIIFARSMIVGLDPASDRTALESAAANIRSVTADLALRGNVALVSSYICARAGDRAFGMQLLKSIDDSELGNDERKFKESLERSLENNDNLENCLRAVAALEAPVS